MELVKALLLKIKAMRFCCAVFSYSLILLFSFGAVCAEELDESKYIPMQSANVRIMSKQSGKAQSYRIPVGKSVKYEKLEIIVRKCLAADEFSPEDFFMFAEISKGGRRAFSGWMVQSEPGANPFQDPDTDLWLVKCE
ncbi:MAG: DUF2155 domain-containing protein [Rickettsiales bacterium]|jgi:hypothetical protein|nr:DUF2155 domain-containing protein [Rickettsiales bacterium]